MEKRESTIFGNQIRKQLLNLCVPRIKCSWPPCKGQDDLKPDAIGGMCLAPTRSNKIYVHSLYLQYIAYIKCLSLYSIYIYIYIYIRKRMGVLHPKILKIQPLCRRMNLGTLSHLSGMKSKDASTAAARGKEHSKGAWFDGFWAPDLRIFWQQRGPTFEYQWPIQWPICFFA